MAGPLRTAWAFLSVLPPSAGTRPASLAKASPWFWGVGLVLGGALWWVFGVLGPPGVPAQLGAVILLLCWEGFSGFLHLDGLADTADAFLGRADRAEALRILREPALGTFGSAALVFTLLFKWAILADLLASGDAWPVLWAPVAGRWAPSLLAAVSRPARPEGLGASLAGRVSSDAALRAGLPVALGLVLLFHRPGFLVFLGVVLLVLWISQVSLRRIGGVTGDQFGTAVEVVECFVLLSLWAVGRA